MAVHFLQMGLYSLISKFYSFWGCIIMLKAQFDILEWKLC